LTQFPEGVLKLIETWLEERGLLDR